MMAVNKQSNITPLNAKSANQLNLEERKMRYSQVVHLRRRVVLVAVMVVVTIFAMVNYHTQYVKYETAAKSLETAKSNLDKANKTNANLKQEVKDLGDNSYLEKLIREKYMYSKDGEVVFNLPGE
ncbi:septum formation initiator [Weissella confusa]|uniref:Septum formation initiator family protein n=2 Tax=Weissella TaxID=46255 RepID=A0AAJ3DB60_WEICO|nr:MULTISPECIES: septum formation initiator family protein [Weissella]MBJ7688841.1 septum formation initiator family protein [Weissella confusa]MBJ7695209.1 septum formation initiator family protein [Weissella confusa]MCW0926964.1 septum formation initiator family protein [Weissella sp. LMG 11983]MDF9299401.1 septum formation initiator family protein [Weissella sp. BK2]NBA11744.1 septum formation initiator family protein [Weissella confusa]